MTHDRFMLGRLSTELLALDGRGKAKSFVDYHQYEAWRVQMDASDANTKSTKNGSASTSQDARRADSSGKLTYKLQHELDTMEQRILEAEARLEVLHDQVADPELFAQTEKFAAACTAMGEAQEEVDTLYARWAELEALKPA